MPLTKIPKLLSAEEETNVFFTEKFKYINNNLVVGRTKHSFINKGFTIMLSSYNFIIKIKFLNFLSRETNEKENTFLHPLLPKANTYPFRLRTWNKRKGKYLPSYFFPKTNSFIHVESPQAHYA